ncbi:hypothetical protein J2X11_000700 [Aeromicrobium panaciterrae]|uniref:Gram-positive cocci surface proteins LPxTG domain-containing protein n=1 Tax=Aeromicrobium panaciterrae TaxID=363861 RepID=A0ABU1UL13_9ACTN|nr:hypothetical protein [Aeromicrobium panaciterrae]MDR7085861.1 hypothetical protein [Aeromicrobium panaciterrae]
MRTANRSLVLVLAFLVSVIAAPAYASDDSPGLLNTVEKTVDAVASPAQSPAVAPKVAGPVGQLSSVVDSTFGGHTSLSDLPLVSGVDQALTGGAVSPTDPGSEGGSDGDDSLSESSTSGNEQVVASRPLTSVLQLNSFSASVPAAGTPSAEGAELGATSTLPDGGSPLTLAWLVLCAVLTTAGMAVIRRTRASA